MRVTGIGDDSPASSIILVPEDRKAVCRKGAVSAVRPKIVYGSGIVIVGIDLKGLLSGLGLGPGVESCGRSIPPILHNKS